jgi:NADH-quinone oxidoreductase subunit L
MELASWTCLLAPLAGVAVLTFMGSRVSRQGAAWLGTLFAFVSFCAAVVVFFGLLGEDAGVREAGHVYTLYTWATSGQLTVPLDVLIDPLSSTEMLIVSGVGALIVMYSVGYMHGDVKERRFFVYMDLFMFSMLLLVMSANFVLLLVGWGMVGLSSYLLIGFWHERRSAVDAAKKAFVMNAAGDVGIAIAAFIMARDLGSVEFRTVFTQAGERWGHDTGIINLIAGLLLLGAVAKSAQIPLHTWLPDAMEGPTPVSALIHAATMVTAGVYLVARAHPLFDLAPPIRDTVAMLGLATLLMAGVIALVQTDIKRIIAYSTMSQIGYMFTAVGVGAYAAAMYHLLTHAFFKALLFLGAGIVIHALDGEQDVRRMGGLSSALPRTRTMMWIGTVALIGIWPLSKDGILASALERGGWVGILVWAGGILGALMTGVYATRLMRLTFYGRRSEFAQEHLHSGHGEAPWTMFWPVAALAAGTILSGFLAVGFGIAAPFTDWLAETAPTIEPSVGKDLLTTLLAWAAGIGGGVFVWRLYALDGGPEALRSRLAVPARIAERKFYWDELYDALAYRPAAALARGLYRFAERDVVWGSISVVTWMVRYFSGGTSAAQSGRVRTYATVFVAGVAVLTAYFVGEANL